MTQRVLIIGGQGSIGGGVARDLLNHTSAEITITGRTAKAGSHNLDPRVQFVVLDLADKEKLREAIATHTLVVHCAGPFRQRDQAVLKHCIESGVHYIDVSDDRDFTQAAFTLGNVAEAAGITAIINTGVFPGISNSMVRRSIEQLEKPAAIHLSYVVGGSGGAGITVMRTTFLNLRVPFEVWENKQWRSVRPYTEREPIDLPAPFGRTGVYWFDLPEMYTLSQNFPVQTVTVKFGTVPDMYNRLTELVAHGFPDFLLKQRLMVEFMAQMSYKMTAVSDRFSGTGVAIQALVEGQQNGKSVTSRSRLLHPNAAIATAAGAASVAQLILSGTLEKPGVWCVEQAVETPMFEQMMGDRQIEISQEILQG